MTHTATEWSQRLDEYVAAITRLREAGLSGDPAMIAQARQDSQSEWEKTQAMLAEGVVPNNPAD